MYKTTGIPCSSEVLRANEPKKAKEHRMGCQNIQRKQWVTLSFFTGNQHYQASPMLIKRQLGQLKFQTSFLMIVGNNSPC